MKRPSQKDRVKRQLLDHGSIDNFWAMQNIKTIRLGAIIHELRQEGMQISGAFIEGTKNYRYTLDERPKRTRMEVVMVDGRPVARPVTVDA